MSPPGGARPLVTSSTSLPLSLPVGPMSAAGADSGVAEGASAGASVTSSSGSGTSVAEVEGLTAPARQSENTAVSVASVLSVLYLRREKLAALAPYLAIDKTSSAAESAS